MGFVTDKYKHTEVGIIPEDWEVYILGNLLNGIADVDHFMPKTEKYGVPYVMTGDLKDFVGDIDFDNCKKISISDYEQLSKKVKNLKGDIILARYATIGTVSFVNVDFDFVVSYSCVTVKPDTSKLIDLFLYYYFKSSIFKLEVKNKVNANIQDNVGIGDLLKMKIPLPPTKVEQTAIATALSDADALFSSLEKLIAKKRNIKQGAMQQLLQPKEGWEVKKLGEIANCFAGGTPSTNISEYWGGEIIWLPSGRVQNNVLAITGEEITITTKGLNESAAKLIKPNSVLIAITGATCGNIGFLSFEASANQSVVALEPNSNINGRFLYYMMITKRNDILTLQTGSAQGGTNLRSIKSISVSLPNIEMQNHIANILINMDSEIIVLEAKLEKYKRIKQGMMQQLLTGKIRLA